MEFNRQKQHICINGKCWLPNDILATELSQFQNDEREIFSFLKDWFSSSETISVHTSGSTGTPKRMLVEKTKMMNSARITCEFFGFSKKTKALLCMSARYIAGQMMLVRALVSGMNLVVVPPQGNPMQNVTEHLDFAAIVPLQLFNILQDTQSSLKLNSMRNVLVGGGKILPELEKKIQQLSCSVWASYGMTETLSHIALRRVNGVGKSTTYTPLQGVEVSLSDDDTLCIYAPHLSDNKLKTNDVARIMTDGSFEILGRKDNIICSGGIKIQLEQVEEQLQKYFSFPFALTSVPDEKFGEMPVLMVVSNMNANDILQKCKVCLPKYHQPRYVIHCQEIPMTETGKPSRAEIRKLASEKQYR